MNKYDINLGTTVPLSTRIKQRHVDDDSTLELAQTISNSHEVLFVASTIFPFTLFPDNVTLDRAKLSIAHKEFFWTGETMSIRVEDILNVTADIGPFFGSLKIYTRFFSTDKPYSISFLSRKDAVRFKRILQGYVIAMQKNLNLNNMPTPELADMLEELGS